MRMTRSGYARENMLSWQPEMLTDILVYVASVTAPSMSKYVCNRSYHFYFGCSDIPLEK
ncbi:hypothetical protein J2T15_001462 [Paenibacillus harenae]|uniref:Uncharacterized protein n=1 Tax=Paenibacillus harenae TaxID=306543 RepID=A0ABT9TXF7_PAEHA|nr:hypothetical protein [Paenibacillus harenae]